MDPHTLSTLLCYFIPRCCKLVRLSLFIHFRPSLTFESGSKDHRTFRAPHKGKASSPDIKYPTRFEMSGN
jgi:hypothetical protein